MAASPSPSIRDPLTRPRWVAFVGLVVVAVVVMVNLGLWQLRRLDDKRDLNAEIEARQALAPEALAEVVSATDSVSVGSEVAFRPVRAQGSYDLDGEALLRGRDRHGTPGFWVLTPLDLGDGTAVVVNRGWIPFRQATDGTDVDYDRPTGAVEVAGSLEVHRPDARPAGAERTTVAHADLEWFDEQLAADVYPVAIRLETQAPAVAGALPMPLDPPELDEGPHLGYAVQWFLFATVAVVGMPVLVVREVRATRRSSLSTSEHDRR